LLEPSGRAALRDLRIRRTEQLISLIDRLNNQLAGTHGMPGVGESPAVTPEPAPVLAALLQAAGALNRLVTAIYTTGDDHIEASIAWPELTREMGKVRRLARDYERYLQPLAEERK
jgi:hypothetical protein